MSLVNHLETLCSFISNNDKKIRKITTIALISLTLIGICIVLVYVSSGNVARDNMVLLSNFRLLLLAGVVVTFVVFFILALNNVKLEWLFLAVALGIGIIYLFAITPMSGGDEWTHYVMSTYTSSLVVGPENTTFSRESDFDYAELGFHHNVPSAYLRFFDEGIRRVDSPHEASVTLYEKPYYLVPYFPQAVGVTLGRLLQLNFFGVFYLGRLTNLLFYILCVFFAIKCLKEFKLPIFIIGILPMSLHQAATFSYDAFINGASMLFLAYVIRRIYERDEWDLKEIIIIAISGIFLSPAKTIYFVLLFLLFLAVPYRYGLKKITGYIIAGGMMLAGVALILFFNLASLQNTANLPDGVTWHGGTNFTFHFVLCHPFQTILILLRTIRNFYDWLFFGMFGQWLSGLTIVLPRWYIVVFVIILFASIFYGKKGSWVPRWWHRCIFIVVCGIIVLLSMFGMMFGWTPNTHDHILGLQGRYYLPILPLAMLILKNKWKIGKPIFSYALIGMAICMHFLVLKYVLDFTISQLH